jgi:hypothetical protein
MKFHLLKAGDRFIFRGEVYFKSTPLVAINEVSGNTRLIPRSAILQPVEPSNPVSTSEPGLGSDSKKVLSNSSILFMNELGNILALEEVDKLAIQKLYEDVTAKLISNICPKVL